MSYSLVDYYRTRAGMFSETGDHHILTVPFPVLRHVEGTPAFSHRKQRATRQMNYDASGKIFFQCRRRFRKDDEGIFGGGTLTDTPVRNIHISDTWIQGAVESVVGAVLEIHTAVD